MPRNYTRKGVSRAVDAKRVLTELGEKADADGLPVASGDGFVLAWSPWLLDSAKNLGTWLSEVEHDGFTYSILLQVWLHLNGLSVPPGVFKNDLRSKGRGRPLSDIGWQAYWLYAQLKSWEKVAQRLAPKKYAVDPNDAAKYVKELARNTRNAPDYDGELDDAVNLGAALLGITKLKQQAEDEYGQLQDELRED